MDRIGKYNRSIAAAFRVAACMLALAMAIILPALRTSHFGPSYKPVEVRQAAARHECLGRSGDCLDANVESVTVFPASGRLAVIDHVPVAARAWCAIMLLISRPAAPRLLRRLRISSDPCGPPDFLAQA
ncbi:MAG: hypothetical protein ACREQR_12560 [Candidatus Binataceae bacterium]